MNERKTRGEESADARGGRRGRRKRKAKQRERRDSRRRKVGDEGTNKSERKPGATVLRFPGVTTEKVNATDSEYQPP